MFTLILMVGMFMAMLWGLGKVVNSKKFNESIAKDYGMTVEEYLHDQSTGGHKAKAIRESRKYINRITNNCCACCKK